MPADERDRPEPVDTSALRKHVDRRLAQLETIREPYLEFCRAVADEIMPSRLPYLQGQPAMMQERAGAQNQHIVDSVGPQSAETVAAGVVSGAMPANSPWYELDVRTLYEPDDEVRQVLQEATRRMRTTHNQSNANEVLANFALELMVFGTAAALFVDDDEDVFRLEQYTIGEYFIAEDSRGRPDTLYRRFTMTVGQIADEWGVDGLGARSRAAYDREDYDQEVEVVHAIEPDRDGRNPYGEVATQPWRSVYFEASADCREVLAVRGYARFPALVTRWRKQPGTPYGLGRGMDALPHLVRLRKMIYRYGQALAFKAQPPLQLPAGLQAHEVRNVPGGLTAVAGSEPVRALYEVNLDLRELYEQIELARQAVRDAMGASLVASLRAISHQMTATEVDERRAQDMMEFLPALYRLREELLEPIVELEWDAMMARGLLPPMPEGMPDVIDIEITSPLARRQRQQEVDAILRTYTAAGQIAQFRPDILENLAPDEAIRRIAEIEGAPVEVLLPVRDMLEQRRARAEAEHREQQAAAAASGASIAGELAQAQARAVG